METIPKANLQLIYVSDVERSKEYYEMLFETKTVFTSPRYVAFSAGGETLFAIWSGGSKPDAETPRYSEIGIMLPTNKEVDKLYQKWKGNPKINILQKPEKEIFGLTFLVKDPDGHLIRVSPLD